MKEENILRIASDNPTEEDRNTSVLLNNDSEMSVRNLSATFR